MHTNEILIDAPLVRQLIDTQFPEWRDLPLTPMRSAGTDNAIYRLGANLAAAWDWALQAPAWNGPPTWVHGDLLPTNLLIEDGRLSAVIDFGCLGVGDPACDLMAAWTVLPADARRTFRTTLAAGDAMWRRGMGWALSFGLIALPYYVDSNPVLAGIARHAIGEVLSEYRLV